jgi:hypothetical protein
MTFSPNERTTVDDPANRPGRRLRRLTRGRPRQITTAAAVVTLLSAVFFAAPTTSSPTPAEAAAAVTQRLLPPKAGPDAKQKCEGPRLVKLKETDAPNYQTTTVPDLIAKNPRATFCFEKGTYRLPTLTPTEGQTFIGTPGGPCPNGHPLPLPRGGAGA